jgi:hypothetical protein
MVAAKDADFRVSAQWIIRPPRALIDISGKEREEERGMPELAIAVDKISFLIEKTREFDVKEATTDPDSGSNPTDDNMIDVLEDDGCDPVMHEIAGFINGMTEDEQIDLIALMRLGRGDGGIEEWNDLRRDAAEMRGRRTARYLLGEPLVSDYLAEGLNAFGLNWTDARPSSA